jgi:hypothetical protein
MEKIEASEGRLVDKNTSVLRADRVLVQQHGPGAIVFLGVGPRAGRLCRLALDAGDDAEPFIAQCRRIDEAIERGDLAKAQDHGIPRAVLDIADRALRRLAIAETLAKAGFDPDEPRVPAGNPDGGQWTTGGGSGGSSRSDAGVQADLGAGDSDIEPAAAQTGSVQDKKQRFVDAHLVDTQPAADKLRIPVENILGLAALESGWGSGDFVPDGNNFFGIHFPAPYANGYMIAHATGATVAAFASYADSLRSFVATSGTIIDGKADPEEFARALQDSGKFGIDPRSGAKVPTYVRDLASTIRGLRAIIARRRP